MTKNNFKKSGGKNSQWFSRRAFKNQCSQTDILATSSTFSGPALKSSRAPCSKSIVVHSFSFSSGQQFPLNLFRFLFFICFCFCRNSSAGKSFSAKMSQWIASIRVGPWVPLRISSTAPLITAFVRIGIGHNKWHIGLSSAAKPVVTRLSADSHGISQMNSPKGQRFSLVSAGIDPPSIRDRRDVDVWNVFHFSFFFILLTALRVQSANADT